MEFLKALERALSLGLTTREFLPIWNLEVKAKQQDNSRDTSSSHRESLCCMESVVEESQLYLKLRSDLQQFVLDEAQAMVSKMSECLEQKWRQRLDQLMLDLGYSGVMSHISDTANSHTSTFELFPMQEVTILEQQVNENVKPKDAETIMETTFQSDCYDFPQESAEALNCLKEQTGADIPDNSSGLQHEKQKDTSCNVDTQQSQAELNSRLKPISDTADCLDKSSKLYSSDTESVEDVQIASSESSTMHTTINVDSILEHPNLLPSQYKCSACQKVKDRLDLLEKADVTSNDATESESSKVDDLKSESETPLAIVKYIPTPYASIVIFNSDTFAASQDTFLTPFYYTKSKSCKVRLGVHFDAKSRLNVYLLVSAGSHDDSKKWPRYISCYGFINNKTSQGFSHVWSVETVKCQKPEPNQEVKLNANVKLKTKRAEHKAVSYEVLQTKMYTTGNILTFHWEIDL